MAKQPVWVSPQEVAKQFNVHYRTILDWIKSGRIVAKNMNPLPNGKPTWRVDINQFQTNTEIEEERKEMLAQLNMREPSRRHIQ